jgi:ABC-type uncharacterized transport system auxiliary subunit
MNAPAPRLLFLIQFAAICIPALFAPLAGCALTSKAEVQSPRYFSPEPAVAARSGKAAQPFELRLGEVSAASHLDDRIAYRVNGSEMGFHEDLRWTESPEAYLRRALARDLFEERGLVRVVTGIAPVLNVELIAFEALETSPRKVRVTLNFSVTDERHSLVERTLDLEAPVNEQANPDPARRLTESLTATLNEAVRKLGDAVVETLSRTPAPQ